MKQLFRLNLIHILIGRIYLICKKSSFKLTSESSNLKGCYLFFLKFHSFMFFTIVSLDPPGHQGDNPEHENTAAHNPCSEVDEGHGPGLHQLSNQDWEHICPSRAGNDEDRAHLVSHSHPLLHPQESSCKYGGHSNPHQCSPNVKGSS